MQVLNSPVWTPLSVIVAVVVGILSLWPRKRKALTYRVVANLPLDAADVRYRETPLADARIVVVHLWNSGNAPIRREDYDKPLGLAFSGGQVISAVSEAIPNHLRDDVHVAVTTDPSQCAVQLSPVLLNPGDSMTITSMVASSYGDFDVQAHIEGTTLVRYDDTLRSAFAANKLVIVLASATALLELNDLRLDIQYRSLAGFGQDVLYLFFVTFMAAYMVYRDWVSRQELYHSPLHQVKASPKGSSEA